MHAESDPSCKIEGSCMNAETEVRKRDLTAICMTISLQINQA